MIPVKNHPGLYRDENTNAIVNCSTEQFQEYMKLKNKNIQKESRIENLEKEISELKQLIQQLLNK